MSALTLPHAGQCVPRFATSRDYAWPSYGDDAVDIAQSLGLHLDPEQRLVVDVALEHHPDGRLRYRHVLLSTPRQQGKSTVALVLILDRLINGTARGWGLPQRAVYGAQSARAASMKLLGEWAPAIEASSVSATLKAVRRSNGTEELVFNTGGTLTLLPMTLSGGHGSVLDMAVLDEVFSHSDDRAEVATRPAMLTRRSPQFVVMSTAGDTPDGSPFLWAKLEDARARALSGNWGNVCGFDWGANDDDDPHDPEVWRRSIPALASGRLPFEVFEAEHASMPEAAWKRSYLNVWSKGAERLIPDAVWAKVQDADAKAAGELHAAVCVTPGSVGDDRSTSIVVVGRQQGTPVVELAEARDGTRWVVDACKRIDGKHRPRTWSVDSYGPSRSLIPELKRHLGESRFRESGTADTAAAAQRLHQAILDGEVRFRPEPVMDAAAAVAEKRMVGDAWCFRLRIPKGDVSPLIAASLAHHQLVRRSESQLRRIV